MKATIQTVFAIILLATTAPARIGETEPQLRARYGAPAGSADHGGAYTSHSYRKNGIFIHAVLKDGKTVCIAYANASAPPADPLDLATCSTLITANRGETPVHTLGTSKGTTVIQSADGSLTILHRPHDPFYKLVITLAIYADDPSAPPLPEPKKTAIEGF
jgi:hypothetical protein